jgi:hypothetical protein
MPSLVSIQSQVLTRVLAARDHLQLLLPHIHRVINSALHAALFVQSAQDCCKEGHGAPR